MDVKENRENGSLFTLLEKAGEAEAPPETPRIGIPHQWIPKWIRKVIQVVFLPFIYLDTFARKCALYFVRPPYKLAGKCKQRGNCCHYILMKYEKGVLGKIQFFWVTQIQGFFLRHAKPVEKDGTPFYIMGCRYLQKNGKCGNYLLRPVICRQWPDVAFHNQPRILKGCGFYTIEKKKQKTD